MTLTNDLPGIQALIDALPPEGGRVDIPAGVHGIDDSIQAGGIRLRTGVHLALDPGAVLKALPSNAAMGAIVRCGMGALDPSEARNRSRMRITGGAVEGNRDGSDASRPGEQGMGILVTNSEDVTIEGVEVRSCWGDGIYLDKNDGAVGTLGEPWTRPMNTMIRGCAIHSNRRNNVSLVGATGVLIDGCHIRDAGDDADGTAPGAGIDLEPDYEPIDVDYVRIINNLIRGNSGAGVELADTSPGRIGDILVTGNDIASNGAKWGFGIKIVNVRRGYVQVHANRVAGNYGDGILVKSAGGDGISNVQVLANMVHDQVLATPMFEGGTKQRGAGIRLEGMPKDAITVQLNHLRGNPLGGFTWDNQGSNMLFRDQMAT